MTTNTLDGIAIIGMTGRFPGAKNIQEFWHNLQNGIESIAQFSDDELLAAGVEPDLLQHPNYVKVGAVLDAVDQFDAAFFGYSPREAETLDPQQRLFLECAWEGLEHAGYDPQRYDGRIGVYAGVGWDSYLVFNLAGHRHLLDQTHGYQTLIGNEKDYLTTRVSYKLNLKGPSLDIQTACSTSLVATSLACQSLLSYQCDMALAGGVAISVLQRTGYLHQTGGVLSPDGHCRAFDAQAAGMVAGNGVGIVVLKRLEDAIADRDTIYAVIKGTAINNDGAVKVGYTAPSVEGQAEVIAEALAVADIAPDTISYIETHGTGTALGDPIEMSALTQVFRNQTEKKQFCAIGSVKTNIGHLDAAAGVASLIKTALALHHKQIPPSLHFEQPNPQIDFANSPFYVNAKLTNWRTNYPHRAGVSSFGIGGTNAHAVLEEAPEMAFSGTSRPWQLLLLSAKTESALESATTQLSDHLEHHPDENLADVAYTLQVGRQRFNYRRVVVCQDRTEVIQILRSPDPKRVLTHVEEPCSRSITFLFPGQGAQYIQMGRDLYQTESVFRSWIDRGSELLNSKLGFDLRDLLYSPETESARERLQQTAIAQPALFLTEYALAQLWISWGVQPQALMGHSVGEYVAACLAGVFSFEDALKLVAQRGQLMQSLPTGSMLAVSLSEEQIQPWLNHDLSVAAINAPNLCVVSGTTTAVAALRDRLTAQNVECRLLHTSHAFHSAMMEPILASFRAAVQQVKLHPPTLPLMSNLTGTWMTAAEATDPHYWVQHLRQTVRFSAGVSQLLQPNCILLEVGPGHTLSTLIRLHQSQASGQIILSSLRHPKDGQKDVASDVAFLLNILGRLWLAGVEIDWSVFYAHEQRRRLPLPTYPFERQRYWIDPLAQENSVSALGKSNLSDWFYIPSWQQAPSVAAAIANSYYLLFADAEGISAGVASQLEQAGHTVMTVMIGDRFTQKDDRTYSINPEAPEDYRTLLQLLPQRPNAIAHFWNLQGEARAVEEQQILGFYSLLYLSQAMAQQNFTDPLQLTVITRSLYDITGQESLNPTAATSLGLCRILPREQPYLTCCTIDIGVSEVNKSENLIHQITAELCAVAPDNFCKQIAYRDRHRWVQTFQPLRLEAVSEPQIPLQPGGVYLITGGTGGIGLSLAQYLAKTIQAKLALISRSGQVASKTLKELEALGAEILVIQADVTNREQMKGAIAQTLQRFGKLNGVIHAAGIAGGGIAQLKTPAAAAAVLAPKVQGTLVLEEVLQDIPLDFLLLCSSLSSIMGEFGQTDYCAANAFLDAFAHYWTVRYRAKAIAINWDTWQQVGMAVNTVVPESLQQQRAASLQQGLTPDEGIEVFKRVLHSGLPQVIVSTQDLQAVIEQHQQEILQQTQSLSINPVTSASAGRSRHLLLPHTPYVAPDDPLEQQIAEIWQDLLGIEPIGIHDNFFELGGHSLLAVQAVSRLRDLFQIELPLQVLLIEASTIAELAQWIESQQPAEDMEAMTQLLTDIENLTPTQLQTQLESAHAD